MDNPPTKMASLRDVLLQAWGAVTPERMDVLALNGACLDD